MNIERPRGTGLTLFVQMNRIALVRRYAGRSRKAGRWYVVRIHAGIRAQAASLEIVVIRHFLRRFQWVLLIPALGIVNSCAPVAPPSHYEPPVPIAQPLPPPPPAIAPQTEQKTRETITRASWYGRSFTGHKTTSGEKFSPHKMTA